jgi:hypothetical protein
MYRSMVAAESNVTPSTLTGSTLTSAPSRCQTSRFTVCIILQVLKSTRSPLFLGNGDILSWQDAKAHREETGVSGLMIARGALIKPWIFTEIKQERWGIAYWLYTTDFLTMVVLETGIFLPENALT